MEKMISSTPEVVGLTSKEDRWDSSVASLATISPRSRAASVSVAVKVRRLAHSGASLAQPEPSQWHPLGA